jgi:hypothetical protein
MHEHYVDSVKWFSEDIVISKVSLASFSMLLNRNSMTFQVG